MPATTLPPTTALTVEATATGLSIDAGVAGTYLWSYPRLLTPPDQALKTDQVVVKPDGTGAVVTYKPGGKLALDKQPDGSWLYHLSDIPPDRVKFTFGFKLPLQLADEGATWCFDGQTPQPFPKQKGSLYIFQGIARNFVLRSHQAGFAIIFPQKIWTMLTDQRVWGMDHFGYGQVVFFPGKKTIPEISYTFKVMDLSALPSPAPVPTTPH